MKKEKLQEYLKGLLCKRHGLPDCFPCQYECDQVNEEAPIQQPTTGNIATKERVA